MQVSRLAVLVVLVLGVLALADACGGGSGGASTTSAADIKIEKALHVYMTEMGSLGDRNVGLVKRITVSDGDVTVTTGIYGDSEGHTAGDDICNLVSTALVNGVKSITVNGSGGDPLAYSSGTLGSTDQLACTKP